MLALVVHVSENELSFNIDWSDSSPKSGVGPGFCSTSEHKSKIIFIIANRDLELIKIKVHMATMKHKYIT